MVAKRMKYLRIQLTKKHKTFILKLRKHIERNQKLSKQIERHFTFMDWKISYC